MMMHEIKALRKSSRVVCVTLLIQVGSCPELGPRVSSVSTCYRRSEVKMHLQA